MEFIGEISKNNLLNLEKNYINKKIIELSVNKKDIKRVTFLLENQYEIIKSNDENYILKKENKEMKTFRISLTENCNYRCFFCHEEGMEMDKKRQKEKSYEDIERIVLEAVNNGYMDITFTGGEPLIKKKWIIWLIEKLNNLETRPDLTIVTNGVLIDDVLLESIKTYKGSFKFNFSMHHLDRDKYFDIVVPKDNKKENFDIVIENIKKIVSKDIYIKLNFVILNGINSSKDDLEKILEFANEIGIHRVKFLEFLVTDKLLNLYDYYYTLESVEKSLKDSLEYISENMRTKYYKYKGSDLEVELSHCTCAIGCSNCILAKDVTVTSELKFFPCFFRSNQGFNLEENFEGGIDKGSKIINAFSKKYGNKTPFKVSSPNFVAEKSEYIYSLPCKLIEDFKDYLKKSKYSFERIRTFEEILFGPKGEIKIYKNDYESNYIEVVKECNFDENLRKTKYIFDNEKRIITNKEKYIKYINLFGVEEKIENRWKIEYFKYGKNEVSLGIVEESNKVYITSKEKIFYNKLEPVNKRIEEILFREKNGKYIGKN